MNIMGAKLALLPTVVLRRDLSGEKYDT